MRRILIVGLIVIAALLPLTPPLAIFVFDVVSFVVADAPSFVSPSAQPIALLALAPSRAPPSR